MAKLSKLQKLNDQSARHRIIPELKENKYMTEDFNKAPNWLLSRERITQRQWRQIKRRELKSLLSAFSVYRMGCAYCPGINGEVGELDKILNSMKQSHSQKSWGK